MSDYSEKLHVPSRNAVHRAGSSLRKTDVTIEEFRKALDTLSQWRFLHSYPINTFQAYLRNKVKQAGYESPIIAQRLKRLPSIIKKLKRFHSMGLETMQDIGGIRVILDNINDVYHLYNILMKSRFPHKAILPPDDYIKEPKHDGYRSLHQVYKYANSKHPELNVLHIELQIRTKLQHSWATAVETLGIVEKSSFKAGEGSEDFKRFFKLSSALFSIAEKQPVLEEYREIPRNVLISELKALEAQLQITTKLKGLAITAKQIEISSNNFTGYHLMILDAKECKVSIINFTKNQLDSAELLYSAQETATKDNPDISVVLISAGNIKEIRKAYPNYLLDTNSFIRNLLRLMGV